MSGTELAPFLNKSYELDSSDDKFNDIMVALGVNAIKRNLAKVAKPIIKLTESNGDFTLSSESTFRNMTTTFKLGQEFQGETIDGRTAKIVFTQEKNKLIEIQKGEKTTRIEREFSADSVKLTVTVDNIVSVRIYKLKV